MGKRVTVLIRQPERQYEGLRCTLGLLLKGHEVSMFVLGHEISVSEEYMENMELIDEMGGARFSNHPSNIDRHGFGESRWEKLPEALAANDVIMPFQEDGPVKLLHILRSAPDAATRALIGGLDQDGESIERALDEETVDYDRLLADVLAADRVICWW